MTSGINIDFNSIESISNVLLEYLPQKAPFRFLDKIIEVSDKHIVGQYTFKEDEWFYKGHFPGRPTTPGVVLIETMAQTGVVAFAIYLSFKENQHDPNFNPNDLISLFTEVEAEFSHEVKPGDTVTIKSEKVYWRRRKLKSKVSLYLEDGTLASQATLSGMGVLNEKK